MSYLFNLESNHDFREGDVVRTPSGYIAQVVAFDITEAEPILVQTMDGEKRGKFAANDLDLVHEGPSLLEPLPPTSTILQEDNLVEGFRTCGGNLCIQLIKTPITLTFISKDNSNLRESIKGNTFLEKVENLLKVSYITRLPHLVENRLSKLIDSLLTKKPKESITKLEKIIGETQNG